MLDIDSICFLCCSMFSLLRKVMLTNLGTEEFPEGLGADETFATDVDEANFIGTPQGYYIPPGCTNGFYYRVSMIRSTSMYTRSSMIYHFLGSDCEANM
jgi:hypothetical protein